MDGVVIPFSALQISGVACEGEVCAWKSGGSKRKHSSGSFGSLQVILFTDYLAGLPTADLTKRVDSACSNCANQLTAPTVGGFADVLILSRQSEREG